MADDRRNLQHLRVVSPCEKSWDELEGNASKRFCTDCNKHVHNLSAMTRSQVDRLEREQGCHMCVRYFADSNGDPLTLSDRPMRFRVRYAFAQVVAFVASIGMLLALTPEAKASWTSRVKAFLETEKCRPEVPPVLGSIPRPGVTNADPVAVVGKLIAPPPKPRAADEPQRLGRPGRPPQKSGKDGS